jgi:hypothetical protein
MSPSVDLSKHSGDFSEPKISDTRCWNEKTTIAPAVPRRSQHRKTAHYFADFGSLKCIRNLISDCPLEDRVLEGRPNPMRFSRLERVTNSHLYGTLFAFEAPSGSPQDFRYSCGDNNFYTQLRYILGSRVCDSL